MDISVISCYNFFMYTPATRVEGPPIQPGLDMISYLHEKYLRERSGDFRDSRLASKLSSISLRELLLLPEEVSGVSLEGTQDQQTEHYVHLSEIRELAAGRQNSRNNVQFGQLHITGNQTHPIAELVAVKYLDKALASRELAASIGVNSRLGYAASFQPVGFMKNPSTQKIGYLTKYEHGVQTLDNVLWDEDAPDTLREEAMGFAGLWLATLHNHSVIHGDAQAKNIAYDSSQNLRYIDLEGARTFDPDDSGSRIVRLTDVSDVFNRVYMPKTNASENDTFVESYLDSQLVPPGYPHYIDEDDLRAVIAQADQAA